MRRPARGTPTGCALSPRPCAATRLDFEVGAGLVIVTTPPGYASPLAQAIDEAAHPHVAGTIAGENTIFIAARDGVPAAGCADELSHHLVEGAA